MNDPGFVRGERFVNSMGRFLLYEDALFGKPHLGA